MNKTYLMNVTFNAIWKPFYEIRKYGGLCLKISNAVRFLLNKIYDKTIHWRL